jgi:hypothetical protein
MATSKPRLPISRGRRVMRWGDDNAWSCQNVARANELLAGRVQGEVAYLRDKVERSGSSPPN